MQAEELHVSILGNMSSMCNQQRLRKFTPSSLFVSSRSRWIRANFVRFVMMCILTLRLVQGPPKVNAVKRARQTAKQLALDLEAKCLEAATTGKRPGSQRQEFNVAKLIC